MLGPGDILQSRYRIIRHVGEGGMGAVYEAVDLRLGHTVALKEMLTSDQELRKQFEREARLLAQLNHPVLPRVSDYFTEGNRAFFVMQFIEGLDLAEIIFQQSGPFPPHLVIAWADQLLDALIYLHSNERQIIHRDIKPHNLKVTPTGRIALLDFGLAKSHAADPSAVVTCTSVFGYSPSYAPLEQIRDLGTGPLSDIYALGATLYHLLTGTKPPDAVSRAAAFVGSRPNPLRPANELNRAVEPELAAILDRAMAQNPEERYASAAEFREVLRGIGRIDKPFAKNHSAHQFEADPAIAEIDDTRVVRTDEIVPKGRLSSRAVATAAIILLSAFGVFCRYYSWKLPPTPHGDVGSATASVAETTKQPSHANQISAPRRPSEDHRNKPPKSRAKGCSQ